MADKEHHLEQKVEMQLRKAYARIKQLEPLIESSKLHLLPEMTESDISLSMPTPTPIHDANGVNIVKRVEADSDIKGDKKMPRERDESATAMAMVMVSSLQSSQQMLQEQMQMAKAQAQVKEGEIIVFRKTLVGMEEKVARLEKRTLKAENRQVRVGRGVEGGRYL